jgi:hypothetical protein
LSFFSPAGLGVPAPAGSFAPTGVALDAAGNVYVADKASSVVDEFTPAGAYTGTQFGAGVISGPTGLAVDASGDVFVASGFSELFEFGPTGTCLNSCAPVDTGGTFGATFDPASGHLYVLDTGYVAEYDSTGALVDQFGQGHLTDPFGLAVNDTTGNLYVGDVASPVASIFGPLATLPDVAVTPASSVQATSATLNGTVNPNGIALSTTGGCEFEYGTSTSYGTTVQCDQLPGQIGTGTSPVPVTATITGLQGNTTYHFRLDATNAGGASQSTDGTFTTLAAPTVGSEFPSGVSETGATLDAQINPNGSDTTYHFEYGATTGYGTSVPMHDADAGSGSADVVVSQQIQGLQAATSYHFRVVATNPVGTIDGPDRTLTTYPPPPPAQSCPNAQYRTGESANLPDCRAYESVTPADIPDGTGVYRLYGWPDGQQVFFSATTAFSSNANNGLGEVGLASRTATGWATTAISAPEGPGAPVGTDADLIAPVAFTSDFSAAFINNPFDDDPLDQDNGGMDVYRFDLANGHVSLESRPDTGPMTTAMAGSQLTHVPPGAWLVGASGDGTEVFFDTNGQLPVAPGTTPDTRTPGPAAGDEIYERTNAHTYLVGILPDGSVPACGAGIANGVANSLNDSSSFSYQAVAPDGSNVVFDASNCTSSGMYLRDLVHGTTVQLPGGGYAGRTPDGTKIFIASDASNGDLTEYDIATGQLTDIGAGKLLASSDDGSHVYYLGSNDALYLWDNGTTTMIPGTDAGGYDVAAVAGSLLYQNVPNATPDGSSLEFIDMARLTGYDNQGRREAYLYRPSTNSVICLSCNPSGAPPDTVSDPGLSQNDAQLLDSARAEGDPLIPPTTRFISSDGRRAVFETTDTLLPQDHNPPQASYAGEYSAPGMDVYEWEADGSGSCQSTSVSGGCLYLLSAGRAGLSSYLGGASADLTDVYIMTPDQLLPGMDGAMHIYDVRIDGGFQQLSAAPACLGDACQGAVTGAPALPSAATIATVGPTDRGTSVLASKVKVIRMALKGSRFALTIQVPASGVIVVSGGEVKTVRRALSHPGAYQLTIALTPGARRALKHRHKLRVTLHARYTAVEGGSSAASVNFTVKGR